MTTIEHTTHPSWCVAHDYGDGSGSGQHQSAAFKAGDLTVDLVAVDEDEPEVRVIVRGDDVYLSPADAEPFREALREAVAPVQGGVHQGGGVQHTPWCTNHQYGSRGCPEDGFCKGDEEYVAGKWETYLTGDYGNPAEDRIFVVGGDDGGPAQVEQLRARLADLLRQQSCAPETGHEKPRLNIEGFFRVGADDRSTSFNTLRDPDRLIRQLRRDHGVCGTAEANPVVILTGPDDEEDPGTVALADDDHYFPTIDRAFRCLEAVRAGLLEAGHVDY